MRFFDCAIRASVVKRAILLMLLSCVALTAVGAGERQHQANGATREATPESAMAGASLDNALQQVAARVSPAVVQIYVSGIHPSEDQSEGQDVIEKQRALGSGVIVDSDGYIVTNAHVVEGAQRIRVLLTSSFTALAQPTRRFYKKQISYDAHLVGLNRNVDIAVVKIDAHNLPLVSFPEHYAIHLGQIVLAVGNPGGLENTVTMGIISNVARQPDPDKPMVYTQTDAAINPGNSGGALVDLSGNLLGINTFIYTRSGGSEGLGFAIPEPVVRYVYGQLRQYGRLRRPEIGAHVQSITPTMAEGLHLSQDWGVIVSDVPPNGTAGQAGLRIGDIVESLEGVPVDSLPRFAILMQLHPLKTPVHMVVNRDGKSVDLTLPVTESKGGIDKFYELMDPQNALVVPLGIYGIGLDSQILQALPDVRSALGVLVVGMADFVPAADPGLDAGDIIRSVNGKQISSVQELRDAMEKFKPGDSVVLQIERSGSFQFLPFEMD